MTADLSSYPKMCVVTGPTASGKSHLALKIAAELGGVVVNMDSVQLYKGFDVGSAKPSREEQTKVPHALFDVADASQEMDAAKYADLAQSFWRKSQSPLVFAGGTGLYLRSMLGQNFHAQSVSDQAYRDVLRKRVDGGELAALYQELVQRDPERAKDLHPNDHVRIVRGLEIHHCTGRSFAEFTAGIQSSDQGELRQKCFWVHLDPDREEQRERIGVRTKEILRGGKLEQEVLSLLRAGVSRLAKPMQSIGYKQMLMYLQGGLAKGELEEKVFYATCQYAKRQRTWFAKTKPDLWLKSFADQLEWKSVAEKVRGFLTPEQAAEPAE